MRKLFYLAVVALVLLLAFSCKKETVNPNAAPVISFASFTTSDNLHAVFTFNFSDANGNQNIGLNPSDTSGIFAPGQVGYYDFYMRYYRKNAVGNFIPYYFQYPGQSDSSLGDLSIITYRIPYLNVNIKTQALNGQIIINLNGYRPLNYPNSPQSVATAWADSIQHFRYEFWIYDRDMHKSNVVTTPEFDTNYPY
jgi:hypothetical protein